MIAPTVSIALAVFLLNVRTVGGFIVIAIETPIVPPITIPVITLFVKLIALLDIPDLTI